jgi:hypothetical protein
MELLLPRPSLVEFGHKSSGVGLHGYLRPIQAWNQPVLLPLDVQPSGWMAERMVFLRNDTDALLPMFTGNHPAPQPSWVYGMARWDIRKLQPLREVIQELQQVGLMGADLPWTFVSCRI